MELLADARSTDTLIRELQDAADEGMAVVTSSPFRVRHTGNLRRMAELVDPLDRALRSTRVLVRQTAVAAYQRRAGPALLLAAGPRPRGRRRPGRRGARRGPDGGRRAARAARGRRGDRPGGAADELAAEVVLAQVRSVVVDLLLLTGSTSSSPPTRCRRRPGDRAVSDSRPSRARARWVLHVDLDQFIAAVEVRRRPSSRAGPWSSAAAATRPSAGSWRPRRTRRASTGSAPGCRCEGGAASARTRCSCPSTSAAYDAASAAVMDTLRSLEWGGVPVVLEVLGWDEAFLAAGRGARTARRPRRARRAGARRGARRHRAALLGRHRRQQAARQDRHRLRQARGRLPGSPGTPGRGDGDRPTEALWGIGRKTGEEARRTRHRDGRPAGRADPGLAAELGPTMGPWYRRLGRGVDTSPVDATPASRAQVARRPSRPTSRTRAGSPRRCAPARAGGRRPRPEGRPAVRSGSRSGSARS